MLKKRLIGVVTVKDGWAVQSLGYHRYLPLGKPEHLVENLDRWGADEILIQIIDRSTKKLGPDFELLGRLGELGLGTPLIYAGGIRSVSDGVRLIQMGADRLVIEAILYDNLLEVKALCDSLGAQALIASLPMSWNEDHLECLDYRGKTSASVPVEVVSLIESGVVSELFVTDWKNEGRPGGFDTRLLEHLFLKDVPIIAFGGLSEIEQIKFLLQLPGVAAIAVGNFLSYREHAIQKIKEALVDIPMRPATYESTFSIINDV